MRYVIAMAAIPAVLCTSLLSGQRRVDDDASARLAATAVETEGVREQRMDTGTFRARFASVVDMPPMREREVIDNSVLLVSTEPMAAAGATVRPPLRARRAALRNDICARHNMRRVQMGRTWRCRR